MRINFQFFLLKHKKTEKKYVAQTQLYVVISDGGSISKVGGPETIDQIFFIYNQGRQWRSEKF